MHYTGALRSLRLQVTGPGAPGAADKGGQDIQPGQPDSEVNGQSCLLELNGSVSSPLDPHDLSLDLPTMGARGRRVD